MKTSLCNFLKIKPIFLILQKMFFILLHKVTAGACCNSNALLLLKFQRCCLTCKKRDWEKSLRRSTYLCCKYQKLGYWCSGKHHLSLGWVWLQRTNSNIPARELWFCVCDAVYCTTLNLPAQYWNHLIWWIFIQTHVSVFSVTPLQSKKKFTDHSNMKY